MHRTMLLTGLAVAFAATVGIASAAEDPPRVPPRGIEGPDVRVIIDAQRANCEGIRLECPPDSGGVEGPETR